MVGALDDEVLDFLAGRGITPASAAVTIGDKDLAHARREAKPHRLPESVWRRLPSLLAKPEAIYWDLEDPGLIYALNEPEGQGKMIVLVDYRVKIARKQTMVNSVRTGRLLSSLEEFENPGRYFRIQ